MADVTAAYRVTPDPEMKEVGPALTTNGKVKNLSDIAQKPNTGEEIAYNTENVGMRVASAQATKVPTDGAARIGTEVGNVASELFASLGPKTPEPTGSSQNLAMIQPRPGLFG